MHILRILLSAIVGLTSHFASAHVAHANNGFFGMHASANADQQQPLQPMHQEPGAGGHLSQPTKREVEGKCGPQFGSCAEGSCCSSIGKRHPEILGQCRK